MVCNDHVNKSYFTIFCTLSQYHLFVIYICWKIHWYINKLNKNDSLIWHWRAQHDVCFRVRGPRRERLMRTRLRKMLSRYTRSAHTPTCTVWPHWTQGHNALERFQMQTVWLMWSLGIPEKSISDKDDTFMRWCNNSGILQAIVLRLLLPLNADILTYAST